MGFGAYVRHWSPAHTANEQNAAERVWKYSSRCSSTIAAAADCFAPPDSAAGCPQSQISHDGVPLELNTVECPLAFGVDNIGSGVEHNVM